MSSITVSHVKLKEGIFLCPQIRELYKDIKADDVLQVVGKSVWDSFKSVCSRFSGNKHAFNYKKLGDEALMCYLKLGVHMSLKIHLRHSHLDFLPENCGAVRDEHSERFHQDIAAIEKRYEEKWRAMLGDYCRKIKRDAQKLLYKWKAKRRVT